MLSAYLSENEFKCRCCGAFPPDFRKDGEISVEYALLFGYFDAIRMSYGSAIPVSSGYRCINNERRIYMDLLTAKYPNLATNAKQRAAAARDTVITPYGAHIFGLALDLVVPKKDIGTLVRVIEEVNPQLRIGHLAYAEAAVPHVHIDTGYMILPRYSRNLRQGARW